jgi:hypothetical protein
MISCGVQVASNGQPVARIPAEGLNYVICKREVGVAGTPHGPAPFQFRQPADMCTVHDTLVSIMAGRGGDCHPLCIFGHSSQIKIFTEREGEKDRNNIKKDLHNTILNIFDFYITELQIWT